MVGRRRAITGMSNSVFLAGGDGSLTEALGTSYHAEAELQELLAGNLDSIAGAQIDRDHPRRGLLVKREAGVPDHASGGLVVDRPSGR
jgi:hypothetical protein